MPDYNHIAGPISTEAPITYTKNLPNVDKKGDDIVQSIANPPFSSHTFAGVTIVYTCIEN